jgi:hypothetical protein
MAESRSSSLPIIVALITGVASIIAALAPRWYDHYFPAHHASSTHSPSIPSSAAPVATSTTVLPVNDPLRDRWGTAIARMNHVNLRAAHGVYFEQIDTHQDGYPELLREDRDRDGFFEIYRVDVDQNRTTDYWFWVDRATLRVHAVPPR